MSVMKPVDRARRHQLDALLQELITNLSVQSRGCATAIFAREQVDETFYQLDDGDGRTRRLYPHPRWPVVLADIDSITWNGGDILPVTADSADPNGCSRRAPGRSIGFPVSAAGTAPSMSSTPAAMRCRIARHKGTLKFCVTRR